MTTDDEKTLPAPDEKNDASPKERYEDQVSEEHDLYDIDSPLFNGPDE